MHHQKLWGQQPSKNRMVLFSLATFLVGHTGRISLVST